MNIVFQLIIKYISITSIWYYFNWNKSIWTHNNNKNNYYVDAEMLKEIYN